MWLFHFSTRVEQPSAHHQENQLYQYIIWYISLRVDFLSDLHTRRPPTRSDIYQMIYWYNWFSWWWALGCLKHVEKWNKHIKKCVKLVINMNCTEMQGQQNVKFCVTLLVFEKELSPVILVALIIHHTPELPSCNDISCHVATWNCLRPGISYSEMSRIHWNETKPCVKNTVNGVYISNMHQIKCTKIQPCLTSCIVEFMNHIFLI